MIFLISTPNPFKGALKPLYRSPPDLQKQPCALINSEAALYPHQAPFKEPHNHLYRSPPIYRNSHIILMSMSTLKLPYINPKFTDTAIYEPHKESSLHGGVRLIVGTFHHPCGLLGALQHKAQALALYDIFERTIYMYIYIYICVCMYICILCHVNSDMPLYIIITLTVIAMIIDFVSHLLCS